MSGGWNEKDGDSEAGVATERTDEWEEVERPASASGEAGSPGGPEAKFAHAI